jgi:site-specific recombinase XerD
MTLVSEAARRFVTERARLGEIRGRTPRTYRIVLLRFAREIGDPEIRTVTTAMIRRWAEHRDVSASSLRSNLIVLRSFFTWATETRLVPKNPAIGVADPKIPTGIPRALQREEVVNLLAACANPRLRLISLLMVHEGLRAAEVAGLTSYDLDVAQRTLHVFGKGEKRRIVPMSDETWEAMRDYGIAGSGPIVRSEKHPREGISAAHVSRMMSRLFTAAGLKMGPWDGRSGHALRHSAAVAWLEDGASPADVRDLMGHESLSVLDRYTRSVHTVRRLRELPERRYDQTPVAAG